jgi:hypothetical protein
VSALVDDIATRGAELRERAHEMLLPHAYDGHLKARILMGYVDIALEHHRAIWTLHERKLNGSALAMVRLVFDAWLRAMWITAKATEQQCEQAWLDTLPFPLMHERRDQIKEAYFAIATANDPEFAELVTRFLDWLKALWKVLSSYTHSGGRQIARRFTGDQVKPSYSDIEIAQALNLSTMALMMLMRTFFMAMNQEPEADEVRTRLLQYFEEFNDRLNQGE